MKRRCRLSDFLGFHNYYWYSCRNFFLLRCTAFHFGRQSLRAADTSRMLYDTAAHSGTSKRTHTWRNSPSPATMPTASALAQPTPTCGDLVKHVVGIVTPRTHLASRRRCCGSYQPVDYLGECTWPVFYRVNMISGCGARRSGPTTTYKHFYGIPRSLTQPCERFARRTAISLLPRFASGALRAIWGSLSPTRGEKGTWRNIRRGRPVGKAGAVAGHRAKQMREHPWLHGRRQAVHDKYGSFNHR